MNNTRAGFTLLELLVVLTITGLLLAILPTGVDTVLPSMRLRNAENQVATDLLMARQKAIHNGIPTAMTLNPDGTSYSAAGAPHKLPPGVTLQLGFPAGGTSQVRFFPDGSSTGGILALVHGSKINHVSVDRLTGRVSLDD